MRSAIQQSRKNGKLTNINKIFGFDIIGEDEKTTNSKFMALVAERILAQKRQ